MTGTYAYWSIAEAPVKIPMKEKNPHWLVVSDVKSTIADFRFEQTYHEYEIWNYLALRKLWPFCWHKQVFCKKFIC